MSCEHAHAQRGIRNEFHAELTARLERGYLDVFNVQGEGRVFTLDRGNRVHGICASKGRSRDFGEDEVFDFAFSESKMVRQRLKVDMRCYSLD